MGEEADVDSDYDGMANDADNRGVEERVLEWEAGLPTAADDLTPLSQPLFPPELASAFSISPEPPRTLLDVYRASQDTLSSLRRQVPSSNSSAAKDAAASLNSFPSFSFNPPDDPVEEKDEVTETESSKKVRVSSDEMEELDSSACDGDVGHNLENIVEDSAGNRAAASKKPRLVWTPQLHKRFVDVVAHLGINSAVPKTMMQLMNVEGLTRENVASHLQKYRLYVKRMQGISDEGPSSPPENSHAAPQRETPVTSTPYVAPPPLPGMIQMPVVGVAHGGHLGMMPVTGQTSANSCGGGSGRAAYHPYPMFGERPREWPRSKGFGSSGSYPRPTNSDK